MFDRYQRGLISDEELAELRLFVSQGSHRRAVDEWLDGQWNELSDRILSDMPRERQRELLRSITRNTAVVRRIKHYWWYWVAVFLLFAGGVTWGWFQYNEKDEPLLLLLNQDVLEDIAPGANKAILTLADGKKIVLDSMNSGELLPDKSARVAKNKDGILVYEPAKSNHRITGGPETVYHTVSTPKGGQYQIWLPDGSKVTLNAASELHYPVAFQKDKRIVTFQGEGYFEIAPEAGRPFLVESVTAAGRQTIEVLGTEFNINTYDREDEVRTSVIHGSVRVNFSASVPSVTLQTGQQSVLTKTDEGVSIRVEKAGFETVAAWKNGLFVFNNEKLPDLLKRVARWYDVTFIYQDNVDDVRFQGNYFRNKGLLDLLQNLELTGEVSFAIEQPTIPSNDERRIYVKRR